MAQVKEVKGPGGPRGMGPKPKVENPGKLLRRIMDEVFRNYLPHCILVLICIVVSALANVQASLFLQTLMDDYIVPMTHQQNPSFAPLAGALLRVGCIYLVGILAAWINARVMVNVTQGTLRNLRTKLFTHMESLPISYFDTHPHGDIMSVYTNDVDTLRQMISQSIPQLVSSVITIVSVFFSMCMLSWQLTIVTMLMVALMLFCSKKIAASSGKYFIQQQRDLGKVNGYIEEMMEGQKVVKVFTHEQQTLDGFRQLNDQLKESSKQANAFSNWRTDFLRRSLGKEGVFIEPYRLPTEAEWEYAARAGNSETPYPWSEILPMDERGCFYANFKPMEGDYVRDGHVITSPVGTYQANDFGLFDMAGNVSEWTSTAYTESINKLTSDLNPEYRYDAAKEDPYKMKRKIVRGGSWKDVAHNIRSDLRQWEYQNEQRSYIGFRNVRSQIGFAKGTQKKKN